MIRRTHIEKHGIVMLIGITLMYFCAAVSSSTKSEHLATSLEKRGLEGLVSELERVPEQWEKLGAKSVRDGTDDEANLHKEIAEGLIDRIHKVDPRSLSTNFEDSLKQIATLGKLATFLERSGGYSDWAIACSMRRRIIACICTVMFTAPERIEELNDLVSTIHFPEATLAEVSEWKTEEEGIDIELSGKDKEDMSKLLRTQGDGTERKFPPIKGRLMETRELIWSGDVATLVYIVETNRWLYGHSLKGALRYIERGGSPEDIPELGTLTLSEFIDFMGGAESMREFVIKDDFDFLSQAHIQALYDMFSPRNTEPQGAFLLEGRN